MKGRRGPTFGCPPLWAEDGVRARLARETPRLRSRAGPAWIDLWVRGEVTAVFAHGFVDWGEDATWN